MPIRNRWDLCILVGGVAVTRFLFRSHFLYDIDSVNFALAMERFDPRVHQPHPPGYFLYICLARLLNRLLHDANLSLVLLSILASCGAVLVIYLLARNWFGTEAARCAGGLFLFSPLTWFYGTVALTYSLEAFFSALVGYLCWLIWSGKKSYILFAGFILGISTGIRPSSLLLLGPLLLFTLRTLTLKQRLAALTVVLLTISAWFLPMVAISGGFTGYFGALLSLWKAVPSKDTVFNSPPATSMARAATIFFIYLLCFGTSALLPLLRTSSASQIDRPKKLFTVFWVVPALCFFAFVFLKFVNSGYLLLLMPPACIWLGQYLSVWFQRETMGRPVKVACIVAGIAANTIIFLAAPLYCSYRSIRRFEAELEGLRTAVPQLASAEDTLMIGFDSHFLGYRHAAYYLPGYFTAQYPTVQLREGPRIFAVYQRETTLLTGLPSGSFTQFMLFPLPNQDSAYHEYLQTVINRLPQKDLRTVRFGEHDFVFGPISDLPMLFPR